MSTSLQTWLTAFKHLADEQISCVT